jgi:hypothetical protein
MATFWAAVGSLAAAFAAYVGYRYLVWTRLMWEEAAKQREATLMLMLMTEYDGMRESIDFIDGWYMESAAAGRTDPLERFTDELALPDGEGTPRANALDRHRHRVSRFFVRTRKLAQAGYLSEDIVRRALEGRAIEDVFLKMVDPLDKARAGKQYGAIDRQFYTDLLQKYPRPARFSK